MFPTLDPGDYILVSKMAYGPRVMDWWKLPVEKKIGYHWHKGLGEVKRGDVFVFNFPQYRTLNDKYPAMYGTEIIKRCGGIPGDSVIIKNEGSESMSSLSEAGAKPDLFPHDSTLNWTIENYGPLYVPERGAIIKLNTQNASHYKDALLYEGFKTKTRSDSVYLNGNFAEYYTFKNDYYPN
jgi:signal peptidase I